MTQLFEYRQPFPLECGASLPGLTIAYQTWGNPDRNNSNTVWICHALTASADAVDWWPGFVGKGCVIDPARHFIICANILGSCYGATGPASINPATGEAFGQDFPLITIRDMVAAHDLLRQHLGIEKIALLIGGSMGGYQAMEWALAAPKCIRKLLLLATSAAESAWGIAIHTAQRMAIEADASWLERRPGAGSEGLKAARAIGMLTYRTYEQFAAQQSDTDNTKLERFRAESYIRYQGEKLVKRFDAHSYYTLTKAMDSHNISRSRAGSCAEALRGIHQPTLLIGISSDFLCPVAEQRFMADHLPQAEYEEIESRYGHDGFLIETEKISALLHAWLKKMNALR